ISQGPARHRAAGAGHAVQGGRYRPGQDVQQRRRPADVHRRGSRAGQGTDRLSDRVRGKPIGGRVPRTREPGLRAFWGLVCDGPLNGFPLPIALNVTAVRRIIAASACTLLGDPAMTSRLPLVLVSSGLFALAFAAPKSREEERFDEKLNTKIPHISTDKSIKYDYDIVYVRAKRAGDKVHKRFYTDIATPVTLEPGADLMLRKPDGKEEVLVKGGDGAVTDPVVSFDGQWVYYTLIHTLKGAGPWQPPLAGADIYKIHVKSRKIVRLTHQEFTPNTGAADWSSDCRK